MDSLKSAALFLGGCLAGGAIAWLTAKKKYERQLEEDVDSVKATYKKALQDARRETNDYAGKAEELQKGVTPAQPAVPVCEPDDDDDEDSMDELLETEGYIPRREVTRSADEPYVISPDEFSETPDGYHTISLYYYADKVLADEHDEVVEDVEDVVGFDSLNHFGEYEDDAVYVRNEARRCDYEILLCLSSYREKFKDRVRWVTTDK